jgi:8-oxo-dGTP pyrophosphatase MutT (NUDIX family)
MDIGQTLARSLHGYAAFDAVEQAHLDHLRAFLASGHDVFSRANPIGHVTASAFVVDRQANATMLTHHAKLGQWFQLGGHVDIEDETVLAAALREAAEESGLAGLTPADDGVFDVDVHTIPFHAARNETEHLHFDVRYLLIAADPAFTISDESNDLRWFDLDEAARVAGDDSLRRMIRKYRSTLVQAGPQAFG